MRFEGTIKSWNEERGFGFIAPSQGGQEIFVHVKALSKLRGRPRAGLGVSFEVELNPEGKKRAKNVEAIRAVSSSSKRQVETPAPWSMVSVLAIPLFVALYVGVAIVWHVSPWFMLAYVALSLACFVTYAVDKSAARANRWRVSESTLHLLGIAGGWPGGLLAQQLLRHKSSKADFRSAFWATACLNAIGFAAFNSPLISRLSSWSTSN